MRFVKAAGPLAQVSWQKLSNSVLPEVDSIVEEPCTQKEACIHMNSGESFIFLSLFKVQASSSIGRASVSKTEGWGFDALLACHQEMSFQNHQ